MGVKVHLVGKWLNGEMVKWLNGEVVIWGNGDNVKQLRVPIQPFTGLTNEVE